MTSKKLNLKRIELFFTVIPAIFAVTRQSLPSPGNLYLDSGNLYRHPAISTLIPAISTVIPAISTVIPAISTVIPANLHRHSGMFLAGIHALKRLQMQPGFWIPAKNMPE